MNWIGGRAELINQVMAIQAILAKAIEDTNKARMAEIGTMLGSQPATNPANPTEKK